MQPVASPKVSPPPRQMLPNDHTSALRAHLVATSERYGLNPKTLWLEPFSYSAVEATRSFTARDDNHSVHVKLWHTEQQPVRDRWLAVHDILESRHDAPRVMDTIDLPHVDATGFIFEHIKGVHPTSRAATDRLLCSARRLHADEELAIRLGFPKSITTVGQYFEDLHIRMLDKDIGIIRAASPNAMVDDSLLAWMEHETRELCRTVRKSTAFEVEARWPTHGDLYEGNTLQTDDGVGTSLTGTTSRWAIRSRTTSSSFVTLLGATRTSNGGVSMLEPLRRDSVSACVSMPVRPCSTTLSTG